MKNLQQQLSMYAAYHRDSRNIVTHFIGIPLIVLALMILLSRPSYVLWGLPCSPAFWVALASVAYYFLLDLRFGVAMGLVYAVLLSLSASVAQMPTVAWLIWGIGVFVLGWIIQFVGHYFEARKPAFFDDIMGLAIGPLFVAAELAFLLGLRKRLQSEMEAVSGPVVQRKGWRPAGS